METGEVKKRYEWIATNRNGRVETYIAEDESNIYFESGRLIPKELLEVQLRTISEEEFLHKEKLEAPQIQQSPQQIPDWQIESILGNPIQPEIKPVEEQNPIKIILDKQKKKDTITILVDFNLHVPNKKVVDLLDVMFDRDEVIEQITNSSISQIDTESVTEKIKESIKQKILELFDDEKDD